MRNAFTRTGNILAGLAICGAAAGIESRANASVDDAISDLVLAPLREVCARYEVQKALTVKADGSFSINPAKLDFNVLAHYRQLRAAPVDFMSDYALAATSMKMPAKIWWSLRNRPDKLEELNKPVREAAPCAQAVFGLPAWETFPQSQEIAPWAPLETEIAQIENLPVSPEVRQQLLDNYYSGQIGMEGDLNPIRVPEMVRMFEQVLFEEWRDHGIEPRYGTPHRWSRKFLLKYGPMFTPVAEFSKLLIALSRGLTNVYMVTEKEHDLRQFILAQPLRGTVEPLKGMTLDQLFRASYRLNEGDVYNALLTIENVLAVQWRDANRENLASTLRFNPIMNYFGKGADHYGSWYHLFGIMLYGYARSIVSAKFVASTESAGSHVLGKFEKETQENHINSTGATLGVRLREIVKDKTWLEGSHDPGFLVPEYYLNLNEDFTAGLLTLARKLERKQ